jgi:hypothetical protein
MDFYASAIIEVAVELFFWLMHRWRKPSKPLPKIVGSVPYCPLKK